MVYISLLRFVFLLRKDQDYTGLSMLYFLFTIYNSTGSTIYSLLTSFVTVIYHTTIFPKSSTEYCVIDAPYSYVFVFLGVNLLLYFMEVIFVCAYCE